MTEPDSIFTHITRRYHDALNDAMMGAIKAALKLSGVPDGYDDPRRVASLEGSEEVEWNRTTYVVRVYPLSGAPASSFALIIEPLTEGRLGWKFLVGKPCLLDPPRKT